MVKLKTILIGIGAVAASILGVIFGRGFNRRGSGGDSANSARLGESIDSATEGVDAAKDGIGTGTQHIDNGTQLIDSISTGSRHIENGSRRISEIIQAARDRARDSNDTGGN